MKPAHSTATGTDPGTASTIRLLHRRRGWLWTLSGGVVAWLVATGSLGALTDNGSGGVAAGVLTAFVLLLTALVVIALIAAVADTVKLRRRDPDVRARAVALTTHHPVRAHAYRYPPKHRLSWMYGWIMLLVFAGLGVAALPGLVDGVAFLAGAENSVTFVPVSAGQQCGKGGCHPVTNGYLQVPGSPSATWPGQAPLGVPFQVRQPIMDWGFGGELIDGDGTAIGMVIAGVFFDGITVLVIFSGCMLTRNWLRHRRMRVAAGAG